MKRLLLFAALTIATAAYSQEKPTHIKALYNYEYTTDTTDMSGAKVVRETMVLLSDGQRSIFYDQTYADEVAARKQQLTDIDAHSMAMSGISSATERFTVIKDFSTMEQEYLDVIFGENYRYSEKLEPQEWQVQSDTMTINGYLCNKATTSYRGRNWIVWYAPEVPVFDGPWKLCGSGGLIFRAYDSEEHYLFELTALSMESTPIEFPDVENAQKCSRKQHAKLFYNSKADAVNTFNTSQSRIQISFDNAPASVKKIAEKKDLMYDFLERDIKIKK